MSTTPLIAPDRRMLNYDELAPWRRDNPAILTGYRRETKSWRGCAESVWWLHNETVNIWTHLIGAVISVLLPLVASLSIHTWLGNTAWAGPSSRVGLWAAITPVLPFPNSSQPTIDGDDTAFFGIFFLGLIVCFTCSSAFHSSLCHSAKVVKFMNRIDYMGILALGTVNYFSTFHYLFFCDRTLRNFYVAIMGISGLTGTYLVCAPRYASAEYRRMRTYTFFTLGFVVLFPLAHGFIRYGLDEAFSAMGIHWLIAEGAFYIGGALLYSERFPECWFPGKFDIVGSSHQIFHVCSLLAALSHYAAIGEGFRYRHGEGKGLCKLTM